VAVKKGFTMTWRLKGVDSTAWRNNRNSIIDYNSLDNTGRNQSCTVSE
jgi:hypothetical protein